MSCANHDQDYSKNECDVSPQLACHPLSPTEKKRSALFIGSCRRIQGTPIPPISNGIAVHVPDDDFPFVLALPDAVGLPSRLPAFKECDNCDRDGVTEMTTPLGVNTPAPSPGFVDPDAFRTPTRNRKRSRSRFFLPKKDYIEGDFEPRKVSRRDMASLLSFPTF
jgi:hypothetical protein